MHGVNKGDRVSIYMPMVMELPIAMLACARIGAVHSIVVSFLAGVSLNMTLINFCRDMMLKLICLFAVCWFLVRFVG